MTLFLAPFKTAPPPCWEVEVTFPPLFVGFPRRFAVSRQLRAGDESHLVLVVGNGKRRAQSAPIEPSGEGAGGGPGKGRAPSAVKKPDRERHCQTAGRGDNRGQPPPLTMKMKPNGKSRILCKI